MPIRESRRDILKGIVTLAGVGGVVFASRLAGAAKKKRKSDAHEDFFFLQLSDTHWGYSGVSNPKADVTLPTAGMLRANSTRHNEIAFDASIELIALVADVSAKPSSSSSCSLVSR